MPYLQPLWVAVLTLETINQLYAPFTASVISSCSLNRCARRKVLELGCSHCDRNLIKMTPTWTCSRAVRFIVRGINHGGYHFGDIAIRWILLHLSSPTFLMFLWDDFVLFVHLVFILFHMLFPSTFPTDGPAFAIALNGFPMQSVDSITWSPCEWILRTFWSHKYLSISFSSFDLRK